MSSNYSENISEIIKILLSDGLKDKVALITAAAKGSPENYDQLFEIGISCAENNRLEDALSIFENLLSVSGVDPRVSYNLGCLYAIKSDFEAALKSFNKALQIAPNDLECLINSASALHELGRYEEAVDRYDKVLSLQPAYVEAWANKGNSLSNLKRYNEAITCFDKALILNPDGYLAWSNKGVTLYKLKQYKQAIDHFSKALAIRTDYAEANINISASLKELKRYEESITYADKALAIDSNLAEGWTNKGGSLRDLGFYQPAIICFDKAHKLKPGIDWLLGDFLSTKLKICDWSGFDGHVKEITNKLLAHQKVINPFSLLGLIDDPSFHKKCAEIFVEEKFPENNLLGPVPIRKRNKKIRIGYFSADFRNHAVSYLTAELFETHNKEQFEIYGFSFARGSGDDMTLRLSKSFNQFINVSEKSDIEIAQLARDSEIDIAIDLGGFTTDYRTGIFSYRVAPIQVSYIGYLGTMYGQYYDYLIADKTIIPDHLQKYYSEKLIYLPCYQVNDRKRLISDKKFTKKNFGLPETGFVFCCFNNNYKILPEIFDSWMRILEAVEGSVLFLYADNELSEKNLKREAEERGVDSKRLIFGKFVTRVEYLARYQSCDLFLDTTPYNAGTTASDALWAGVPVLTLIGNSFPSRIAASLLNGINLPELIATSQEEYENLAVELANNPEKLALIKKKLSENRLNTPLFDTPLFTRNIEKAFEEIFDRYQMGLIPENIAID